jgi:hypothetical protein
VTGDILEECFSTFRDSAVRLETLPAYSVPGETERIAAWREGRPRPERSVRTSEYLREVAQDVIWGKERARIRVLDLPMSDYALYQVTGYMESAAAGEEIRVAVRRGGTSAALADLDGMADFWLFDAGTEHARAVLMDYDETGRFTGSRAAGPVELEACEAMWDVAERHADALNEFLARASLTIAAA